MVGNVLVALVLLSGEIDVQANVTAESRVGEAPVVAFGPVRPFVAEILTPAGMFEYRDPGLIFQAVYDPRIYWSDPNAIGASGPLLLHNATLLLNAKTTHRLTLVGSLSGSLGQPDYIQLTQFPGQVPQVQKIASVTGRLAARVALARRWALDLDGQLFYWKSLGFLPGANAALSLIKDQKSANEQAIALYQLTPRHALGFGAAFGEASYNGGSLGIYTIGPTVTWKVRLTPLDELRLMLGLTYVRSTGLAIGTEMPLFGSSGHAASPIGAFELVSRVARRDEFFILANASGGVDYFVDPVLATAVPHARAQASLSVIMAPDWSATLEGDFSTAIRSTPYALPGTMMPPLYPDETLASLTLSARRRINPAFYAEIGGLWAERAPAFVTPNFEFHQRQLWIFARLSWTSHPLARPVESTSAAPSIPTS